MRVPQTCATFANSNNAGPSLTFTLVFALLCSVCYFSFCANKVGFTKADLQGRGLKLSLSEACSPESLLCAMHRGCHHGNSVPLVPRRWLALWKRKVNMQRERERERDCWQTTQLIKRPEKQTKEKSVGFYCILIPRHGCRVEVAKHMLDSSTCNCVYQLYMNELIASHQGELVSYLLVPCVIYDQR